VRGFLALVMLAFIALLVWAGLKLEEFGDDMSAGCRDRGGVLVDTREGVRCIKAELL